MSFECVGVFLLDMWLIVCFSVAIRLQDWKPKPTSIKRCELNTVVDRLLMAIFFVTNQTVRLNTAPTSQIIGVCNNAQFVECMCVGHSTCYLMPKLKLNTITIFIYAALIIVAFVCCLLCICHVGVLLFSSSVALNGISPLFMRKK